MAQRAPLRERKKVNAMRRIQEAALDLFDELGFANVTIDQIADAAEVSPSSIYRYFGTKEQIILRDDFEVEFFDIVETELASHPPVTAVRRALSRIMTEFFDRDDDLFLRRTDYTFGDPALRAAGLVQTDDFARGVAEALARATARPSNEFEVQVIAAALVWSMAAAIRHWRDQQYMTPLEEELEKALALVENGLTLGSVDAGPADSE